MIVEGRMEKCLGDINRKIFPSKSLLTRREHPEQTWYQTKNTSKQRRDMLDFTRKDRARSTYTKLVKTRRCKKKRTLDIIPTSCRVTLIAMGITSR
jgi:hypothetical protein